MNRISVSLSQKKTARMPAARTALKTWTTRSGKRRVVRLYAAWKNLLARTRGTGKAGNGQNYWAGKPVAWANFEEFRRWSIGAGYSRVRCSLDRRKPHLGYSPANCRWVTVAENTLHENLCRHGADYDPECGF